MTDTLFDRALAAQLKPQSQAIYVSVSPDLAREWLLHNHDNRPLDSRVVMRYADLMERGQWEENGETVKFDWDGNLFDGQHRLAAIVKSAATVPSWVMFNLPPDAFKFIDTGKRRTKGDVLSIMGYPNRLVLSAAAGFQYFHDQDLLARYSTHQLAASVDQIITTVKKHDGLHYAITRTQNKFRHVLTDTAAAFSYYNMARIDKPAADFFFDKLQTGTELAAGSPILSLREYFMPLRQGSHRVRLNQVDVIARLFKGWNYFRNGTRVQKITWASDEAFPQLLD